MLVKAGGGGGRSFLNLVVEHQKKMAAPGKSPAAPAPQKPIGM